MSGYLIDTSIFVGGELGRPLGDPPPGMARVSIVTLTELRVGVHGARSRKIRDAREETLKRARAFIPLGYDEHVSEALAKLLAAARRQSRRTPTEDAIIAATAVAHGLTVWTQDEDFDALAELEPKLKVQQG